MSIVFSVRVPKTYKSKKIALDLGWLVFLLNQARRAKENIFVIRDSWRNAEDRPKDK